jgi:hypothetical protein
LIASIVQWTGSASTREHAGAETHGVAAAGKLLAPESRAAALELALIWRRW